MRVALVADPHANLVAFEAVLADLQLRHVDRSVCLGDVAAFGPQPAETIARLRELGWPVVMGNTDEFLFMDEVPPPENEREQRLFDLVSWAREQLAPADVEFVRSFEPTVTVPLGDGDELLCFHGSPTSFNERLLPTTPDDELARALLPHRALIMACGHTHLQMFRRVRDILLVNAGSVGLPAESIPSDPSPQAQTEEPLAPWAEYAIVDYERGNVAVELRRVPVDRDAVARSGYESGMPHVDWAYGLEARISGRNRATASRA
jgi:predicted phosphodiesterase